MINQGLITSFEQLYSYPKRTVSPKEHEEKDEAVKRLVEVANVDSRTDGKPAKEAAIIPAIEHLEAVKTEAEKQGDRENAECAERTIEGLKEELQR